MCLSSTMTNLLMVITITLLVQDISSLKFTDPDLKILWSSEKNVRLASMDKINSDKEIILRVNDYYSGGNVSAIGFHYEKKLILVADTTGVVRKINMNKNGDKSLLLRKSLIDAEKNNGNPNVVKRITIDWLNHMAYLVYENKITRLNLESVDDPEVIIHGFYREPFNVHVDPINGFLFWSIKSDSDGGIFKVDLNDLKTQLHYRQVKPLIASSSIGAFTLDYLKGTIIFTQDTMVDDDGKQVEFPVIKQATIDGKRESVIRHEQNIVSNKYHDMKDMVYMDGRIYWSNGADLFYEELINGKSYHNKVVFSADDPVILLQLFTKIVQPDPLPKTTITKVDVRFSDTKAVVMWSKPEKAHDQGVGAFTRWNYTLEITSLRDNKTEWANITEEKITLDDLTPNATYSIRIRPLSSSGAGNWSVALIGNTSISPMSPSGSFAERPSAPRLELNSNRIIWNRVDFNGAPRVSYELYVKGGEPDGTDGTDGHDNQSSDDHEWKMVYNGSSNYWYITSVPFNVKLSAKIRAKSMFGYSNFSTFDEFTLMPSSSIMPTSNSNTLLAIVYSLVVFSVIVIVVSCYVGSVKKKQDDSMDGFKRGLNELVPLPELPSHMHHSNVLYEPSISASELALIPRIKVGQIELIKELGCGAFGTVYEGVVHSLWGPSSPRTRVAIKTLKDSANEGEREDFLKEAKLMGCFNHPHILRLLAVGLDSQPNCLILELMEGGDLLKYLRDNRPLKEGKPSPLTFTDLLSISIDVAKGCKYLEDMHFIHRDLATRNCLVSSFDPSTRVVKIGDFGLARDVYKNDYYRKGRHSLLPYRWMPPESLVDGLFTTQSDVWSFGILLWEIMTMGEKPYPTQDNFPSVLNYVRCGNILPQPVHCPEEIYTLMKLCWSFHPEKRPSFAICLQRLECLASDPVSSATTAITTVHNLSYSRNYILSPSECKVHDLMDSTTGSDDLSHRVSLMSTPPYLRLLASAEDLNGYEVPPAIHRPLMKITADVVSDGEASMSKGDIKNGQSVQSPVMIQLPLGMTPPPPYSQLFAPSCSTSPCTPHSMVTSPTSPAPEGCSSGPTESGFESRKYTSPGYSSSSVSGSVTSSSSSSSGSSLLMSTSSVSKGKKKTFGSGNVPNRKERKQLLQQRNSQSSPQLVDMRPPGDQHHRRSQSKDEVTYVNGYKYPIGRDITVKQCHIQRLQ